MAPEFWQNRWVNNDIGFHQASVHSGLAQHWRSLDLEVGSDVLVPLSGKSLDMVWLAEQHGHDITGIELSEVAVGDFFKERGIKPASMARNGATLHMSGPYALWCGDFFKIQASATAHVAAVYDRAALVAMPAQMRDAYAAQLIQLTPYTAPIFLVTLDYDPSEMIGPPFPVTADEIKRLFGAKFSIETVEQSDVLVTNPHFRKRGLTHLSETVSILRRKG
jgi:thiopurine S-methyltransferase